MARDLASSIHPRVLDILSALPNHEVTHSARVWIVQVTWVELKHEYGFELAGGIGKDYDAVIITVCHEPYTKLNCNYFSTITKPNALIVDLKGMYRGKITDRPYWSF